TLKANTDNYGTYETVDVPNTANTEIDFNQSSHNFFPSSMPPFVGPGSISNYRSDFTVYGGIGVRFPASFTMTGAESLRGRKAALFGDGSFSALQFNWESGEFVGPDLAVRVEPT